MGHLFADGELGLIGWMVGWNRIPTDQPKEGGSELGIYFDGTEADKAFSYNAT